MSSIQKLQDGLTKLQQNKVFELTVIAVIILSALVIGAKTYETNGGTPSLGTQLIAVLDIAITLFFLIEIIVRMIAEGNLIRFFKKAWNIFDFIIVVASLIPFEDSEAALLGRLLRVFRILRLVSVVPELRILVNAFMCAIPRMGYVALLMFVVFYIYAAIGSMIFSTINPTLWGNISISMLTLFRISTFEDWTDIMYETMAVYSYSWIFYVTFIFIAAFVFLNMMIGIVVETLQIERELQDREAGEGGGVQLDQIEQGNADMAERLERIEKLLADSQINPRR